MEQTPLPSPAEVDTPPTPFLPSGAISPTTSIVPAHIPIPSTSPTPAPPASPAESVSPNDLPVLHALPPPAPLPQPQDPIGPLTPIMEEVSLRLIVTRLMNFQEYIIFMLSKKLQNQKDEVFFTFLLFTTIQLYSHLF